MFADKKLIKPDDRVRGFIKTQINQDPFHCDIDVTMSDPAMVPQTLHGGYTEKNLGKLLGILQKIRGIQVKVQNLDDIIPAIESLEGRECICTMDKRNFLARIISLIEPEPELKVVPAPPLEVVELIFKSDGQPPKESIRMILDQKGEVLGWAVLPTAGHGLVIDLPTKEVALQVLKERRNSPLT